jgi:DNA (cytosine-5)-methyltransferase 1
MKVLSLFSGVGGFDMGLENAGMQTVFQCEWDKHANTILNKHWRHVPKWEDVSTLTGKHILTHAPVIDVVAWGSPCQDLSVAGKRSGLEGERSGLFHEGIRIIKELRKETNGQYPRISIWENVVGALNSNRGADFGIIINEMAEAGAMVIEWAVLDAQYFGVPQRRRRVFVIAIFDPVLAERSPSPLLPVAESLPGHLAKGKPKRKSATPKTSESVGTDGETVGGLTVCDLVKGQTSHQALEQNFLQVVEDRKLFTSSSFAGYEEGVGTLRSTGGDLGGGSETLVTEPFVKSSRAQTSDDSETWIPGEVNPTLNSFDVGDTRATTAIIEVDPIGTLQARQHKGANHEGARDGHLIVEEPVLFENSYRDGARIANDGVSQTLTSKMGTGGGNTPMLAFDTQFGSNANVTEDVAPTLKASQQSPSVAYAIQGNVVGRQDHNGLAGKGHTEEGDPMFRLTSTDIHAVAFSHYDSSVSFGDVSPTLRSGTNGTGHSVALDAEPTMAVRRLTPLECERLMGWPDDHTQYKADGTIQADTHRYKQCGNGVASPVAQWIAKHILNI